MSPMVELEADDALAAGAVAAPWDECVNQVILSCGMPGCGPGFFLVCGSDASARARINDVDETNVPLAALHLIDVPPTDES